VIDEDEERRPRELVRGRSSLGVAVSGRGAERKRWDGERDLLGRICQTFAMCGTGSDSKAAKASVSVCCMTWMDGVGMGD
jgi:hypothetical protein